MKKIRIFIVFCLFANFLTIMTANCSENSISDEKQVDNSTMKYETENEKKQQQQFQKSFEMKSPKLLKIKKELESQKDIHKENHKSLLHIVLMYIPNRILDLTDVITMGLGFGPEASCEVVATEYFQFSGAYGDRYFIEKGYNRQYGGGYYSGHTVGYVCWKNEISATDYTFGYVKPYVVLENGYNIPDYKHRPYSNGIKDFWRIGLHLGWILDLSLNVHPVAIANFFTGFFFIRLTDTEEI